ncbi:MAG: Ulp1 protease family [Lasallia pustulata]|uniref:Ulp1 protease family n=1 Tax=Lasallia pustulata TaxID=136370 RepID=A0A5M8PF86_9LECA|nr:MAG: Ulp1 protease family [Lasallia pustulata]
MEGTPLMDCCAMEEASSTMDWQRTTPPFAYTAPPSSYQSSVAYTSPLRALDHLIDWESEWIAPHLKSQPNPAAPKRSFANYAEDTQAPQGPEAVKDSRYSYASKYLMDTQSTGYNLTQERLGNEYNNYNLGSARLSENGARSHWQPNQPNHWEPNQRTRPNRWEANGLIVAQEPFIARDRPYPYTPPNEDYPTGPLAIQIAHNIIAGAKATSLFAVEQVKNLTMATIQHMRQARDVTVTTASTLRHGAVRARRLAQRSTRRAHEVYTCAVQAAHAAKRRCMQFTVSRREPVPMARRPVAPPSTPRRSPRRSPPRFTSARIDAENDARMNAENVARITAENDARAKEAAAVIENDARINAENVARITAENDARAKEAAAIIESNDVTRYLPPQTLADLQLQNVYGMGGDRFMDETQSVSMYGHVQSSPLSERPTTYSPVAVSPVQPIAYSPATVSSAETIGSSQVSVSPIQPTTHAAAPFSFAIPAVDSTVTNLPIQPIACSPTTYSIAASTADSPLAVSEASLSDLYSPAAVPSAKKTRSQATAKKKSPGIARHSQKTPKKIYPKTPKKIFPKTPKKIFPKTPKKSFQKTPKKNVGFYVSPRTGMPVSQMKKYVIGEPIGFPVDQTPTSSLSSCTSSFLRGQEPIDSPSILEDRKYENRRELGTHQNADLAGYADNTSDAFRDADLFGNSASLEQPEASVNENLNSYEHEAGYADNTSDAFRDADLFGNSASLEQPEASFNENLNSREHEEQAVPIHHDILRPIQNRGTVITWPQTPSDLVVTELGSPIKAGSPPPVTSLGDQPVIEAEVSTVSEQHDEVSNKENKSPPAAPVNHSQHLDEHNVIQSSSQPEQTVDQSTTPATQQADPGAAQAVQPSDGPVTPVRLNKAFRGLGVSVRRSSTRQQQKREAANQRKAEQAAKEAEEKAFKARAEEEARKKAEEERQKKLTRRVPTEKVIQPLSSEWEEKVSKTMALADGQVVAVTSTGTKLLRGDLGTLLPQAGRDSASGWLNDEIITAYLQAVVDHGLATTGFKKGQTPKYYAFNTFFYTNIRDKGPDSVKRWASKARIGGKNLENVERIFIPVHEGSHWTLLVVSPVLKTIEYFDSLGGAPDRYVANTKAWLAQEMGRAWKEADWEVIDSTSPLQNNGKDCGVFTVTTAKMVVLGVDPMAYGCEDIPLQRKRMVAELIHGGFTKEFEPPETV